MGVTNEYQFSTLPEGWGIWERTPIFPSAWYEASANIAVSIGATGIGPTLTFNASAGTSDIAIARYVLPDNFKREMNSHKAAIIVSVPVGNVEAGVGGSNPNLELELKFVFTPPRGSSAAVVTVDYLGVVIASLTLASPSDGGFLTTYHVDALAGLTDAQKALLDAGWTMDIYARPNETVDTNVAMVIGTCYVNTKVHASFDPTLTVLA